MITVDSDPRDFLQVFMAFGLAAVLEQERDEVSEVWWDSEGHVNIQCGDATLEDAAKAVKEHAERATKSGWMNARSRVGTQTRATLSPRIGRFDNTAAYRSLQRERWTAVRDVETADSVDAALVGALGEPAYWFVGKTPINPDMGASVWEMKTRNRGQEFVGDRLSLLAKAVALRDWIQIEKGLDGSSSTDEVGKDALDSRTPTGLRRPGSADNAVAWCALLGLGVTGVRPTAPSSTNQRPRSTTYGATRMVTPVGPKRSVSWLYVPIPTRPITLSRLKAVYRSESLSGFVEGQLRAAGLAENGADTESVHVAAERLRRKGIGAVSIARKHYSDNPNAPESWAIPALLASTVEGD